MKVESFNIQSKPQKDCRPRRIGKEVLSRTHPKPRRLLYRPFGVNLRRGRGNTHGFLLPPRVLYCGFPHEARIWRGLGWIRDSTTSAVGVGALGGLVFS